MALKLTEPLSDYFSGDFPGSFARGVRFQVNELTGDARISGTAASLSGVEAAVESGDAAQVETALHILGGVLAARPLAPVPA